MIEVELPDGSIAEFPDGTSHDVIKGALQKRFGASSGGGASNSQTSNASVERAQPNPAEGLPYGQPPEGMVLDPETGQMVDTKAIADQAGGSWAGSFIKGMPFIGEYADELVGGGDPVKTELARQMADKFEADNPKTATAGRIATGLTTLPAAVMAGGALPMPASIAGKMGAGALYGGSSGAIEGAISGYGEGRDGERAERAAQRAAHSGIVGTLVGGVTPSLIALGEKALKGGLDYLRITRQANKMGLDRGAADVLNNRLGADDAFGGAGAARIAAAGDDAMLADAGPSTQALLDLAVQKSGKAGNIAREAIEARAGRAGQNFDAALDSALGQPQGIATAERAIRDGSRAARSSTYGAAYDMPIDYSAPAAREMEDLLSRVGPGAVRKANRLMELAGDRSKQILADIADDGTVTFKTMPDVRQIDYITRALREEAEAGEGMGALGGQTDIGRALKGLSTNIRGKLRELVPEYGAALDTAADPISRRQALQFGNRLLSPATARDEVTFTLDGMSKAERQAAKEGVRSHIDDLLANVKRSITDGNMDAREAQRAVRDLSSRANKEKLTALLGDDEAGKLFTELDKTAQSLDLRASVAANSKTYARQSAEQEVKDLTEPGAFGKLLQGQPLNATQRIAQAATKQAPKDILEREQGMYSNIVKALVGPQGGDAMLALRQLEQIYQRNPKNAAVARALASYGVGAAALPSYQKGRKVVEALLK